jgi:hypothetical protein
MKNYILKKDLPNVKAGEIFVFDDEMYAIDKDSNGKYFTLFPETVENNPEWFKELKPMPLGVLPLKEHNRDRLNHINARIGSYRQGRHPVPQEWIDERKTLEQYFKLDSLAQIALETYRKNQLSNQIHIESRHTFNEQECIENNVEVVKFSESDMKRCFDESRLTHPFIGFKHKDFEEYKLDLETRSVLTEIINKNKKTEPSA